MRGAPRIAWGLAAAIAYVAAVAASLGGRTPVRPLFDGLAPPRPYSWVSPPPQFAAANQPPLPGRGAVRLTPSGSDAATISTGDGQASVVLPTGAFAPREGQRSVALTISPQRPGGLGAAPGGLRFDGNAYTLRAEYRPAARQAHLRQPVSVVLRFPVHATVLLRWTGTRWMRLDTTTVRASLQVFADSDELGTFAAGAPAGPAEVPTQRNWAPFISLGAVALAALAGLAVRLRTRRRLQRDQTQGVGARGLARERSPGEAARARPTRQHPRPRGKRRRKRR